MNLELAGKVAIVGGGSKGIGYAIAHTLAQEGATIAITARHEAELFASAERISNETGAVVLPISVDSRKAESCKHVVETVRRVLGKIDILVNNAGAPPLGPILSFSDLEWEKAVEQNLLFVTRMVREVVPAMKEVGGGSILNITAISAIQPISGFALSVATWAGVIAFAKTLSIELGDANINVNTICPGYIDTPRLQKVFAGGEEAAESVKQRLAAEIPLGRIGSASDIANLVALLVSPKGSYITGTAIQVDGGLLRATR